MRKLIVSILTLNSDIKNTGVSGEEEGNTGDLTGVVAIADY